LPIANPGIHWVIDDWRTCHSHWVNAANAAMTHCTNPDGANSAMRECRIELPDWQSAIAQ